MSIGITGETRILTYGGIHYPISDLIGTMPVIWDGFRWISATEIENLGPTVVYEVCLTNGHTVRAAEDQYWWVFLDSSDSTGDLIRTKNLQVGTYISDINRSFTSDSEIDCLKVVSGDRQVYSITSPISSLYALENNLLISA